MKKMLPVALLLCLSFSLSGFAPAHSIKPVVKTKTAFASFPINGTCGSKLGTLNYVVSGGSNTPSTISFYQNGALIDSRPFVSQGSNSWLATGMSAATGISGVYYHNMSGSVPDYVLDFISPY